MPLPDVAKAVKGRRILNTTTLNKKNNTKLTACAKKKSPPHVASVGGREGCRYSMLRGLFGTEDFEYYYI